MKTLLTFVCSISLFVLFGQEALIDIDTTLDYQMRFYKNDKLITTNTLLYIDSTDQFSEDDIRSNPQIDTTRYERVKHGLWIEYFDKKWNQCDSSSFCYYRLGEYEYGYLTGKNYYFSKKGKLLKTSLRYPITNDTIFNGVRWISYKKRKVTWVEYRHFIDDTLQKGLYINLSSYYPNGQLKSFCLSDDDNYEHLTQKYTKYGLCYYELKLNYLESHIIRVKRRKEVIKRKEDGVLYRIIMIDGLEVKRKKCS